jgi:hypothetical protein
MAETRLEIALEDIRQQSGFDAVLLTDTQGIMLAESQESGVPEQTITLLHRVANEVATQIAAQTAATASGAISPTVPESASGESEFFDWDGRRVVCRWFEARRPGILVVLVPKGKSYKWAIGRMVKEMQRLIGM